MRRSQNRRAQSWFSGRRRIVAAVATLVAFGGIVTVTQVSNASTRSTQRALAACDSLKAPSANQSKYSTETKRGASYTTNKGQVTHHPDDGAQDVATTSQLRQRCRTAATKAANSTKAGEGRNNGGNNNGGNNVKKGENLAGVQPGDPGSAIGVLANDCSQSVLTAADGFQNGNTCVTTEFGEVPVESKNTTLLITGAPGDVRADEAFQLTVSTRNLQRDRFLAAGQGGYYVESSLLQQDGVVRGHIHTACRVLDNVNEAPDPKPVPEFFVATEDGKGGVGTADVTINVPALGKNGIAQCSSWAGDGSHRIPMMQRANQTPGFDSVKIKVGNGGGGGNNNGGNNNGGNNNNNGGGNNNGGNNNNGGGNNNGGNNTNAGGGAAVKAIQCPTVADKLGQVPNAAQNEVMRNLALLETQIQEAQKRLNTNGNEGGANFVNNAILGPLEGKRQSTLDRISLSFQRAGAQAPAGLGGLAKCSAA